MRFSKYVEGFVSLVTDLDELISKSQSEQSLVTSNIKMFKEDVARFSMLLLNPEEKKLYWFYWTN